MKEAVARQPLPKRRSRKSLVFTAALLAVFAAGAAIVAADFVYAMLVLGAWRPNYWLDRAHIPRQTSIADPELGFARKPGLFWKGSLDGHEIVYRTDENGFRNADGIRHADIAFIGDSYTEAAHVPEELTFVSRIAQATGLAAVNLGRGAYGPQQELIVLKRYALRYQPKVIVWQFFTGNDINDAEEFASWVARGRPNDTPLFRRYVNSSLLRRFLKAELHLPSRGTARATLRFSDGSSHPLRVRYEREPPLITVGAQEIRRAVAEAAGICRERGITLIVFTIPTMLHILQPYIEFERDSDREIFVQHLPADRRSKFTSWLNETCDATPGCTFVDVWSGLRAEAQRDNRGLYIPNDEHLDVRGHQVIARMVVDTLRGPGNVTFRPATN